MVTHQEIKDLVNEWGLREDVIEKDYIIGWLLWGIGSDSVLSSAWAFKGGTALKKCYIETWRFSEDLDFTVLPNGPVKPEEIEPIFKRILERIHEESGIDFSIREMKFKYNEQYLYTQGSIYYRGPRNAPTPSRIKLDLSRSEKIICPTVLRDISHRYTDTLPKPAQIRCYAFEEIFAEKLRAMGERGRPRDLYDIILLFRRPDLQVEPKVIKSVLIEKCASKNVPVPTIESIQQSDNKAELVSEWENMLVHQLPALPPFKESWEVLPNIFAWLEEKFIPTRLSSMPAAGGEDLAWTPPPTIWTWGFGVPLESIRFAAVNHLCVELGYSKESGEHTTPIIEPYSLRRTKDGNLILHAIKTETGETRTYRVDRIKHIKVTTKTFQPKYEIEFSPVGAIHDQPTARKSSFYSSDTLGLPRRPSRPRSKQYLTTSYRMKYIFQCDMCMKKFTKSTNDPTLRAHKNSFGIPCSGRHGYLIGNTMS